MTDATDRRARLTVPPRGPLPASYPCAECGAPVKRPGARCRRCEPPHRRAKMRAWHAVHRPRPAPIPQPDPALPPIGELIADDDGGRVQCHVCGGWYVSLVLHIARKHGLGGEEYRHRFGLARTQPLVAPALSAKMRQAAIDGDRGAIGRLNLEPTGGRPKGIPNSQQTRIRYSRDRRHPDA